MSCPRHPFFFCGGGGSFHLQERLSAYSKLCYFCNHLNCVLIVNWIIWNKTVLTLTVYFPVGWGSRIHRLHLYIGVRPSQRGFDYDTKQSDGEVPAMLELWGMGSAPLLPLLPGLPWPGVVAPDMAPIYSLNRTKPWFFHYTDFCIETAYLC